MFKKTIVLSCMSIASLSFSYGAGPRTETAQTKDNIAAYAEHFFHTVFDIHAAESYEVRQYIANLKTTAANKACSDCVTYDWYVWQTKNLNAACVKNTLTKAAVNSILIDALTRTSKYTDDEQIRAKTVFAIENELESKQAITQKTNNLNGMFKDYIGKELEHKIQEKIIEQSIRKEAFAYTHDTSIIDRIVEILIPEIVYVYGAQEHEPRHLKEYLNERLASRIWECKNRVEAERRFTR